MDRLEELKQIADGYLAQYRYAYRQYKEELTRVREELDDGKWKEDALRFPARVVRMLRELPPAPMDEKEARRRLNRYYVEIGRPELQVPL